MCRSGTLSAVGRRWPYRAVFGVTSRVVVESLDTVRVSGSDHAVMSSGLATSSSVFLVLVTSSMECSDR